MSVPRLTLEALQELKRKDLVALCKEHGIKCTGKNTELIEKLLEGQRESMDGVGDVGDQEEIKELPAEPMSQPADNLASSTPTDLGPVCQPGLVLAPEPAEHAAVVLEALEPKMTAAGGAETAPKEAAQVAELRQSARLSGIHMAMRSVKEKASRLLPPGSLRDQENRRPTSSLAQSTTTVPRAPSSIPVKANALRPMHKQPKYDAKESLKNARPTSYKPYTGPLPKLPQ